MNGIELARTIKARAELAGVRLIMLTSLGVRDRAGMAPDSGFVAVLTKPVRQARLESCIADVLGTASPGRPAPVAALPPTAGGRILVVEDNPVNQRVAILLLRKLGHRADAVANGVEAIEASRRIRYDVILMDCQMPEMDGYAATRAIRAAETPDARVPIVAMTAGVLQEDRERCLAAGMDDYLAKPVREAELANMLARWLRGAAPVVAAAPPSPGLGTNALQGFLYTAPAQVVTIREAVSDNDAAAVESVSETLRAASLSLGANRLAALCADLLVTARARRWEAAALAVEQLADELEETQRELAGGHGDEGGHARA